MYYCFLSLSYFFLLCLFFSSLLHYCFLSPFPIVHSSHSSLSPFSYFSTSLFSFCYLFLLHCVFSLYLFFLDLRFFCLYFVLFFSYFLVVMFSVFLHFLSFCLFFLSFTLFAVSLCPFVLLHTLFLFSPLRSSPFSWTHFVMFWKSLVYLDLSVFVFHSSNKKHLKWEFPFGNISSLPLFCPSFFFSLFSVSTIFCLFFFLLLFFFRCFLLF